MLSRLWRAPPTPRDRVPQEKEEIDMSIPILTTTEPGFMGSVGPLLPHQRKYNGKREIINAPRSIYFHGKLESHLGYDIPIILKGKMDFSSGKPIIVHVVHPNKHIHTQWDNTFSVVETRWIHALVWQVEEDKWYITYPDEMGYV
jgi:hypothetical protein